MYNLNLKSFIMDPFENTGEVSALILIKHDEIIIDILTLLSINTKNSPNQIIAYIKHCLLLLFSR